MHVTGAFRICLTLQLSKSAHRCTSSLLRLRMLSASDIPSLLAYIKITFLFIAILTILKLHTYLIKFILFILTKFVNKYFLYSAFYTVFCKVIYLIQPIHTMRIINVYNSKTQNHHDTETNQQ